MSEILKLVTSIQNDITNPEVSLESILLKVKVLAYRFDNNSQKVWVKHELDGYENKDDLPSYRFISSPLFGTFSNGFYMLRNQVIAIATIHPELQESAARIPLFQSVSALEEMSKSRQHSNFMSGDWLSLYNIYNAKSLSHGSYQLIEAYRIITDASIKQILSSIRNRLLDFILEISDLPWNMENDPPPSDQINQIFKFTIYNQLGETNMSNSQLDNGDTYNVGQAGSVGKYARSDGNTFIQSEQKQDLAKAAEEIQELLKQLEKTNPSATQPEIINYINDETTPSLKRRASSALMSLGESALDEYVLESKFLKVIKATIKGWMEAPS